MAIRRAVVGLVAAWVTLAAAHPAAAADHLVLVADLSGEINSVTASYLDSVTVGAPARGASALVVRVDTPGGDSTSMDDIAQHFLNAPLPVIVYVSPPGSRDDSAGLFVSQAADVLAMAPGTNIGSAHPILVDLFGSTTTASGGDVESQKILNDAVARIRNLATAHGRNADWAEQAVRKSVNIDAAQAVNLHVADLEAPDLPTLLNKVDGRVLHRQDGRTFTLDTAGAAVEEAPLPGPQALIQALVSPDLAYILLLLAAFGIVVELLTPGAILPGVVGVISAILALISLTALTINFAGVLLILFAFGLFVVDLKASTHGVLTTGGLISMALGSLLVFNGPLGPGVDPWLVALVLAGAGLLFGLVLRRVLAARRRPVFVGDASILGSLGEAREALEPEGMIFVQGALWRAVSRGAAVAAGARVEVTGREGLTLEVRPVTMEEG